MDSRSIEAVAARWFAKRQSDLWTEADQQQLDAWLSASTAHRVSFIRLTAAWNQSARLKALGAGVPSGVIPTRGSWRFSPLFHRATSEPEEEAEATDASAAPARPRASIAYRALAAGVLLALCLGAFWILSRDNAHSYRTGIGVTDTIPLPDGSRVILNTDSSIRVALNETERRIELDQGEAFFAVAQDSKRPFMVVAGDKRVVAVGTKFSVRRESDDVRVVVTEGRVRLEQLSREHGPSTQLDAGAIAQTARAAVIVQRRPLPEAEQILSWRTGYLSFRDTELGDAVAEINRYIPRKIVIRDADLAHIRIGGNFRSDNAEAFLWLLQNGFPIDVEEEDDKIVLSAR